MIARWTLAALSALALGACADPDPRPVELRFEAVVGDAPVSCGQRYTGVGSTGATVEVGDARFYVSRIRGVLADGSEVVLALDPESPWQHEDVALLDFEDGSGRCSDAGTAARNATVHGTLDTGGAEVVGLRFELGLPHRLNHGDVAVAPPPLNLNALYWNWRSGYVFTKVDLQLPEADFDPTVEPTYDLVPTASYLLHIGSTGCEAPVATRPPDGPCANPNVATIALRDFDLDDDHVVFDLAAWVEGIDLTRSVLRPPGCMSGRSDPDCTSVLSALGLDPDSGQCVDGCRAQRLVRVRPGPVRP